MSQAEGWDFSRIFNVHSAMMFMVDPQTLAVVDANHACEAFYGYSRQEFQRLRLTDLNTLDEAQLRQEIARIQAEGRSDCEVRHRLKNGEVRDVEIRSDAITLTDGRVVQLAVVHDISQRKEQERKLRASEERLRKLVESTREGIIIVQDGQLMFANPSAERITGFTVGEMRRMDYLERIPPEDQEAVRGNHSRRLRGLSVPESYAIRIIHKNGELRWLEINGLCIETEGRPATLNFLTDITQRKQDEAQRLQRERLQAAVATAGAACHELNQPLQGVLSQLELLLMKLPEGSGLRPDLERALDQARQMAEITQNLNRLTDYRTRQYLERTRILDLDHSSA